jgi:hypothetical protein
VETDAADVNRDAVLPAPPDRAGVSGLVDPLHDRAAVHLAAEVYVRRLGQEPQRDFPLLSGMAVAFYRATLAAHLPKPAETLDLGDRSTGGVGAPG